MAVAENLKTFSLSRGPGLTSLTLPLGADLACSGASEGLERLSFTLVLRALGRSRKGGTEMEFSPLEIWAQELMKCHVEVPSSTA